MIVSPSNKATLPKILAIAPCSFHPHGSFCQWWLKSSILQPYFLLWRELFKYFFAGHASWLVWKIVNDLTLSNFMHFFKVDFGFLIQMHFISLNTPFWLSWSYGKINWCIWIECECPCIYICVSSVRAKETWGCSGAPIHVPVIGCRLCGSSTGLAWGHLAAKERCPSWPRSNWIAAIGLATWKLRFSFLNTEITSVIPVTLPALWTATLWSWKTISLLDSRIKLQRK